MKKETLMAELKSALQVALLKEKDMHAVAADKNKTNYAFGFIVAAAVISGLGLRFFGGPFSLSWGFILGTAIYQIVFSIIGIYVLSVVAKSIFKGQAHHDAFFRVMAFGTIVTWLSILPKLSIVSGIWGLVIVFVVLKTIHKLTTGGAIGAILVSFLALMVVGMVLGSAMGSLGMGSYGYGGMNYKGSSFGDFNKVGDYKMKINTENGQGSVDLNNGKMTIVGPDGKKMEITIPKGNQ